MRDWAGSLGDGCSFCLKAGYRAERVWMDGEGDMHVAHTQVILCDKKSNGSCAVCRILEKAKGVLLL